MKQWEYKIITWYENKETTIPLELLGEQGWELVETIPYYSFGNPTKFLSLFKREKKEAIENKPHLICPICDGTKEIWTKNLVNNLIIKKCPHCKGTGTI